MQTLSQLIDEAAEGYKGTSETDLKIMLCEFTQSAITIITNKLSESSKEVTPIYVNK
jgi:hypothetical protein